MGFETQPPEQKRLGLRLLGSPEASLEGHPVRFRIKKEFALLCYLAAEGGSQPRGELAELLWPQSEERHARADLRAVLHKLKKTLGEDIARDGVYRYFVVDGDLLGLDPRRIDLDLEEFEATVSLARREISPGGTTAGGGRRELIDRLQRAMGLYRGDFMEGFSLENAPEYELWLEGERARWRLLFGELCERLTRLEVEEGLVGEAIETARIWAKHAPLEEAAYRRLMELLASSGDGDEALLAYEGLQNTLSRALGTEPSSQLQVLAHRIQEEVEERASLGAHLIPSAATSAFSMLEVPLVGRQEEFGALVSEYQAAGMGQTRFVTVLGEAGMGKTRLVEEFLLWARARGADVLEGWTTEGAGLPYGPLVAAIRQRMERERAPDDLLENVWLSELSRLLPELKERYPDLPSPTSGAGELAKGTLFEAIVRLAEALASRAPSGAPVVLFLDDLEWADSATLEVLNYAGKRWAERGASVLVLIAARPEEPEAGSAFERWLSSSARGSSVRNLTLGPLGKKDIEGLLRRLSGAGSSRSDGASGDPESPDRAESGLERFGERLAAETDGQPFYLVETLKVLLEEEKLILKRRVDGEQPVVEVGPALRMGSALRGLLPQSVREVIHARLSRLSAGASELARAGAVLQSGFTFETMVRVAGLGDIEGLRALDELIERHILREEPGSQADDDTHLYPRPTYFFTHEKIRQVAYTEMGHARRRLLHRRAFEMLEEGGAPAARLARHALAGGLAEQAFRYGVAAGDAAMELFSVNDAVEHYERARDLLTGVRAGGGQLTEPSVSDLEHLYIQLGRAYELPEEWEKAREAYEAMLSVAREVKEARLEVGALNNLAVLAFHRESDPPRARRLLEEASRVAEEAGLEEWLVETDCNLADVMTYGVGEFERSGTLARNALVSARALEVRPDLTARALETLARVELFRGRLEESAAYAEEGAELSRKLAERPSPRRLLPSMPTAMGLMASWEVGNKAMEIQCLMYLAYVRVFQGKLQEGVAFGRGVLGKARELPERAEAMGSPALSLGLLASGEYEEALEVCLRGTELARITQDGFLLWHNLDHLGRSYEGLLDLKAARHVYEETLELGALLGPQYEALSSASLCAVAALSEDWEEAHARALRALGAGTSFDVLDGLYLHHEVEALLRGGDEQLSRENVRRFADRPGTNERERIVYLRSLAVLSEWEGDAQRTMDHLREAEELAEKTGLPKELWQIRSKIGELHEQHGEAEKAREAFSLAADTLRMLARMIGDEKLREGFLSAPRARRVLAHD